MKKKILFASCICCNLLLANSTVVPNDKQYYKAKVYNTVLIYPKKYIDIAQNVADLEVVLQPQYEQTFSYKLDETLYVGILSEYNQITNGFTTIYPMAREMNYIGGSLMSDYFCTNSWIDTLIYHETSHAYQLDAKDNQVSKILHNIIKNGVLFLPWFVTPNIFESSFLLEGNSVLNESWHGNGGRLYGGNFKAETLLQAKYNLLTPQLLYNDNLNFLYANHFYTLGAYFEYFLMQRYGLDKVNSYWKIRSNEFAWPFLTNYVNTKTFGKDFETLVKEWNKSLKKDADNIKEAQGKEISSSQFFNPLNANKSEIYLLVNKSAREFPDLIIYNKKQKKFKETTTSHIAGKVIKHKSNYVTQASSYTNPWRIHIGLYDEDGVIVDGTKSKVIEGYTKEGKAVYFDVTKSYHNPQLYIGNSFYDSVNSSVYINDDDIYYAKQDGKKRTYYKNKTPLFSVNGYYGHITDVKNGSIYFISNTKLGSGLYKYKNGEFYLMHPSDTIIDAKLIDENTALVISVGHDRYKILEVTLKEQKQKPYEVKLAFENKPYYKKASREKADKLHLAPKVTTKNPYHSLLELKYSGLSAAFGFGSNAGFIYMANVNFSDPLTQNSVDLFAQRNTDEFGFIGATYTNTQYFLNYSVTGYGIYERPDEKTSNLYSSDDERTYGIMADAYINFFRYGYNYGTIMASYYEDYVSNSRKPFSTSITLGNAKHFGYSMDENFLLEGSGYYTIDRGDNIVGGVANFTQGLPNEFFIKANTQYSKSNAKTNIDDRGVKIARTLVERFKERDISSFYMPSLIGSAYYIKDALAYGGEVKKVFNFSAYFFTFPLSLRRESLLVGYEHYDFTGFNNNIFTCNEAKANLTLDTLVLNIMPIPFAFEYIYNDKGDNKAINKNTFIFRIGLDF